MMKRKLRKALLAINATPLEYTMAFILYQVNGYDNAMAFVTDLEKHHGDSNTNSRTETR